MKIAVLPIVSNLHDDMRINEDTMKLLNEIQDLGKYEFILSDTSNFYDEKTTELLNSRFSNMFSHFSIRF